MRRKKLEDDLIPISRKMQKKDLNKVIMLFYKNNNISDKENSESLQK